MSFETGVAAVSQIRARMMKGRTESGERALLYTGTAGSGGTLHDLGTLHGGSTTAYAINTAGVIVGNGLAAGSSTWSHAFVYVGTPDVDGHMIDLNTWLAINNPTEAAKWTLTAAKAINDSGLIVGTGTYNDGPGGLSDGTRAYLLDASSLVPEPSGMVLTVVVGGSVSLRRRR